MKLLISSSVLIMLFSLTGCYTQLAADDNGQYVEKRSKKIYYEENSDYIDEPLARPENPEREYDAYYPETEEYPESEYQNYDYVGYNDEPEINNHYYIGYTPSYSRYYWGYYPGRVYISTYWSPFYDDWYWDSYHPWGGYYYRPYFHRSYYYSYYDYCGGNWYNNYWYGNNWDNNSFYENGRRYKYRDNFSSLRTENRDRNRYTSRGSLNRSSGRNGLKDIGSGRSAINRDVEKLGRAGLRGSSRESKRSVLDKVRKGSRTGERKFYRTDRTARNRNRVVQKNGRETGRSKSYRTGRADRKRSDAVQKNRIGRKVNVPRSTTNPVRKKYNPTPTREQVKKKYTTGNTYRKRGNAYKSKSPSYKTRSGSYKRRSGSRSSSSSSKPYTVRKRSSSSSNSGGVSRSSTRSSSSRSSGVRSSSSSRRSSSSSATRSGRRSGNTRSRSR